MQNDEQRAESVVNENEVPVPEAPQPTVEPEAAAAGQPEGAVDVTPEPTSASPRGRTAETSGSKASLAMMNCSSMASYDGKPVESPVSENGNADWEAVRNGQERTLGRPASSSSTTSRGRLAGQADSATSLLQHGSKNGIDQTDAAISPPQADPSNTTVIRTSGFASATRSSSQKLNEKLTTLRPRVGLGGFNAGQPSTSPVLQRSAAAILVSPPRNQYNRRGSSFSPGYSNGNNDDGDDGMYATPGNRGDEGYGGSPAGMSLYSQMLIGSSAASRRHSTGTHRYMESGVNASRSIDALVLHALQAARAASGPPPAHAVVKDEWKSGTGVSDDAYIRSLRNGRALGEPPRREPWPRLPIERNSNINTHVNSTGIIQQTTSGVMSTSSLASTGVSRRIGSDAELGVGAPVVIPVGEVAPLSAMTAAASASKLAAAAGSVITGNVTDDAMSGYGVGLVPEPSLASPVSIDIGQPSPAMIACASSGKPLGSPSTTRVGLGMGEAMDVSSMLGSPSGSDLTSERINAILSHSSLSSPLASPIGANHVTGNGYIPIPSVETDDEAAAALQLYKHLLRLEQRRRSILGGGGAGNDDVSTTTSATTKGCRYKSLTSSPASSPAARPNLLDSPSTKALTRAANATTASLAVLDRAAALEAEAAALRQGYAIAHGHPPHSPRNGGIASPTSSSPLPPVTGPGTTSRHVQHGHASNKGHQLPPGFVSPVRVGKGGTPSRSPRGASSSRRSSLEGFGAGAKYDSANNDTGVGAVPSAAATYSYYFPPAHWHEQRSDATETYIPGIYKRAAQEQKYRASTDERVIQEAAARAMEVVDRERRRVLAYTQPTLSPKQMKNLWHEESAYLGSGYKGKKTVASSEAIAKSDIVRKIFKGEPACAPAPRPGRKVTAGPVAALGDQVAGLLDHATNVARDAQYAKSKLQTSPRPYSEIVACLIPEAAAGGTHAPAHVHTARPVGMAPITSLAATTTTRRVTARG